MIDRYNADPGGGFSWNSSQYCDVVQLQFSGQKLLLAVLFCCAASFLLIGNGTASPGDLDSCTASAPKHSRSGFCFYHSANFVVHV